jgi:hypothetical protein
MLGVERNRGGWGRYLVQVMTRPYEEARDSYMRKERKEIVKEIVCS